MPKTKRYLVKNGKVTSLYEDQTSPQILKQLGGEAEIRRASHVEAACGKRKDIEFTVDLSPSQGPVMEGFNSYQQAVAAEINWINQNILSK